MKASQYRKKCYTDHRSQTLGLANKALSAPNLLTYVLSINEVHGGIAFQLIS